MSGAILQFDDNRSTISTGGGNRNVGLIGVRRRCLSWQARAQAPTSDTIADENPAVAIAFDCSSLRWVSSIRSF